MKILIAACMDDCYNGTLEEAASELRRRVDPVEATVHSVNEIDWANLRAATGGFDGAYAAVAREFDALVMIETAEGGLGRGVYEIADGMHKQNKSLAVWRNGEAVDVSHVEVWDANNYKERYGRAVVE